MAPNTVALPACPHKTHSAGRGTYGHVDPCPTRVAAYLRAKGHDRVAELVETGRGGSAWNVAICTANVDPSVLHAVAYGTTAVA